MRQTSGGRLMVLGNVRLGNLGFGHPWGCHFASVVADREHLRYLQQDSTDLVQERFDVV